MSGLVKAIAIGESGVYDFKIPSSSHSFEKALFDTLSDLKAYSRLTRHFPAEVGRVVGFRFDAFWSCRLFNSNYGLRPATAIAIPGLHQRTNYDVDNLNLTGATMSVDGMIVRGVSPGLPESQTRAEYDSKRKNGFIYVSPHLINSNIEGLILNCPSLDRLLILRGFDDSRLLVSASSESRVGASEAKSHQYLTTLLRNLDVDDLFNAAVKSPK